jgi:hypothetical protein
MQKQREFIKAWLQETFEPGAVRIKHWYNDSRCMVTDGTEDMPVMFYGRTLVAGGRPVARMKSPRERKLTW